MSIFDAAAKAIFTDSNMSKSAVFVSGGVETNVSIIVTSPDQETGFGAGRFVSDSVAVNCLVSEVPNPKSGDTFVVAEGTLQVMGEPMRNGNRTTWNCEAQFV